MRYAGAVKDRLLHRADSAQFRINAIVCLKYIDKKSAITGASYLTN